MMRVSVTVLLDVIGLLLVFVGVFMFDWRLGVALVGAVLLFVSFMLDGASDRSESAS